jgi:hypothetical protein
MGGDNLADQPNIRSSDLPYSFGNTIPFCA